jgi:multiple sugar transport system substrate-binding protein
MFRKRVLAAAAAAVLLLSLAACSGSDGGADSGKVEKLTVLDYFADEPAHSVAASQLKACGASVGVTTVAQTSVPGDSLIQKVLQQASSRTLPDILMLDNPDVQQIAAAGALAPLNDYGITGDGFVEGVVDAANYKGKLYALQPGANSIAVFYNKDILSKAGIAPPTTWQELVASAKRLTAGKQYGFAFAAPATYEGAWQFLAPMWSNGGDEKNLRTPEVAAALQLWKDLVIDGSASKSVVSWSQGDVNDQFVAGKAAMMLNGPWQIPVLQKAKINFGVVPFPVNSAGQTSVAPLGGEAWTVPQTGSKAKMAKAAEVVKCLNSDANQLAWAKGVGVVPTKTSLASQFSAEVPAMADFAKVVSQGRARTGELGDKWPDTAKDIYGGVQLVLTGQAAPADAMAKAAGS